MFYTYNENLIKKIRNRKPCFITYISHTIFAIIALCSLFNNNMEFFIFMILFMIGYELLSYFNRYLISRHPSYKTARFTPDLERFKANGIPLGATLKEDYLFVRGLLYTEVCLNDVYINDYFIERRIYYKDIKSFSKSEYNSFIDFRDSFKKQPNSERFFISYFFDNSDNLLNELYNKVQQNKNQNNN